MSQEELERREHKNKVIMSVVLGVIMLFSTAGYFVMDFSGQTLSTIKYNNIQFKQNEYGLWDFTLNGIAYQTTFNPEKTENISTDITTSISSYSNQPVYFSSEPIEDMPGSGAQEIMKNLQSISSRMNYACTQENCSSDYVVKDCSTDNLIIFQASSENQTFITQEYKCIKINYALGDVERASDAFLFELLGVKK